MKILEEQMSVTFLSRVLPQVNGKFFEKFDLNIGLKGKVIISFRCFSYLV